jgi:dUTP pyrophosphatase
MISLQGTRTHDHAQPPKRATMQAACWDVSACLPDHVKVQVLNAWNEHVNRTVTNNQITLFGGERALIPTGWRFDIPEGYSVRLHPRSGLAWKHGITLANAEGVIDSDYTQETYVLLCNQTDTQHVIHHGDRVAQFEIVPVCEFTFAEQHEAPSVKTDRQGGFGSTGISS